MTVSVPFIKKNIIAALFSFCLLPAQSQTLSPGDIAIIGCNRLTTLAPYELAIVTLADIPSGTVIYIGDYPYANATGNFVNTTNVNEGAITWIPFATIPKGTVFLVKIDALYVPAFVSGLPGSVSVTGWTGGAPVVTPVTAGGENWFIYQGSGPLAPSSFIYGWTNYSTTALGGPNAWLAFGTQGSTNATTSELPPGLVNGTSAVSLAWLTGSGGSHGDNNVYNGPQSGTKASLLAAIGSYTNWNHDEILSYQLTNVSAGTTNSFGNPFFSGASPSFTISNPLPVQLQSFTATKKDQEHILRWASLNEIDFAFYEIQKSTDGRNFIPAGKQNAVNAGQYQFVVSNTDNNTCYYRLKMVDRNGTFSYSGIVLIPAGSSTIKIAVYPNPAADAIQISCTEPIVQISITNLQGQTVFTKQPVQQHTVTVPVAHLAKGTYIVHVQSAKKTTAEKIIKR